jgi:hypothetical protein
MKPMMDEAVREEGPLFAVHRRCEVQVGDNHEDKKQFGHCSFVVESQQADVVRTLRVKVPGQAESSAHLTAVCT